MILWTRNSYGDENIANPATANNSYFGAALIRAVSNHSVPLVRLQDMATRLMAAYYQLNQDQGYPALNFNQQDNLYVQLVQLSSLAMTDLTPGWPG